MPRITKVTTRTGDDGTTALGDGRRVRKDHPRIEAYGTVDELNAILGVVLASPHADELTPLLQAVQQDLFHAGAELCVPQDPAAPPVGPRIEARHIERLDGWIAAYNGRLEPLKNFVLPGGTLAAAQLHVARTVCRRVERLVVTLGETEPLRPELVRYLNRLSDLLFIWSRFENKAAGVPEPTWDSRA